MSKRQLSVILCCAFVLPIPMAQSLQAAEEQPPMTFFVTSVGVGNGADLGGLDGADKHCQALAEAADAKGKTWRAYLSTQAKDGEPAVSAKDRIGEGPWHNAKGVVIAANLDSLHYDNSNIDYAGALNEYGNTINSGGMGNSPNQHDMLTGSNMDGTAISSDKDKTCSNWTNSGEGSAIVGHHDRFRRTTPGSSWNSVHPSRGCSQDALKSSGGAGLFYCFAID
jgi:hypothetical protein